MQDSPKHLSMTGGSGSGRHAMRVQAQLPLLQVQVLQLSGFFVSPSLHVAAAGGGKQAISVHAQLPLLHTHVLQSTFLVAPLVQVPETGDVGVKSSGQAMRVQAQMPLLHLQVLQLSFLTVPSTQVAPGAVGTGMDVPADDFT